jgi:hypothetical protein
VPRLGWAVIAWPGSTREPQEARRRAARATAAFETFAAMLDSVPPLRQPTDAELIEVLRGIYHDIVLGQESISAAVLSAAERAEEGRATEQPTPADIALLGRKHDEQSVATRRDYLAKNDLRCVEPLSIATWPRRALPSPSISTSTARCSARRCGWS